MCCMRHVDTKQREKNVLHLVVESYIAQKKPISSSYLCEHFGLSCSTATIRSVMESLERRGFLSHVHTSSGRVPTQEGFKQYVNDLKGEEKLREGVSIQSADFFEVEEGLSIVEVFNKALDNLSEMSGYTSLFTFEGKCVFKGTRFIFNQPEFEDIHKLRSVFYTLEVKIQELQEVLSHYLDEEVNILIGDDIGFEEISDCSLIVSGLNLKSLSASLALLGPMRMDYVKAVSALYFVRQQVEETVKRIL